MRMDESYDIHYKFDVLLLVCVFKIQSSFHAL